jgi:hypothetical protein
MSCASALENFAARDFSRWTGLPESCSLTEVTQRFRLPNDGYGLARLGKIKRDFRMLIVESYDQPVRVWSDGPQVLMLDVEYPNLLSGVADLMKDLGEPQARFDCQWGTTQIAKGEWVYSDRGLALFVSPENSTVFHLAVFPSTTMQSYEESFRLHLGERRFPAPRQR